MDVPHEIGRASRLVSELALLQLLNCFAFSLARPDPFVVATVVALYAVRENDRRALDVYLLLVGVGAALDVLFLLMLEPPPLVLIGAALPRPAGLFRRETTTTSEMGGGWTWSCSALACAAATQPCALPEALYGKAPPRNAPHPSSCPPPVPTHPTTALPPLNPIPSLPFPPAGMLFGLVLKLAVVSPCYQLWESMPPTRLASLTPEGVTAHVRTAVASVLTKHAQARSVSGRGSAGDGAAAALSPPRHAVRPAPVRLPTPHTPTAGGRVGAVGGTPPGGRRRGGGGGAGGVGFGGAQVPLSGRGGAGGGGSWEAV
jgi:hypothetical protein